jgi:tRNA-2-methylthio-N6-dimethylallyladenosine synthase
LENNKKYVGNVEKVLVIGVSEKDDSKVYGYTETMKLVNIIADKNVIGEIVDVVITDAKSFSLDGILK